ncbi:MAG: adenine phosphoribosyltransferase [Planctomycetes bacterium]|nr:adenine phosphoribosyltransferase [Planctomycetota bacterium]MCW8135073.1 adenine phosphoribosyltransferase [Planctomycetota bacterium]
MESIKKLIRDIPDFPKPGIIFKDITPILGDPAAMAAITGAFEKAFEGLKPTRVVGIESRGFIFGALLARAMNLPFTPVRKPGKLPYDKISVQYTLEYGEGTLEMHTDGVTRDDRVLVMDDLLATGGTAAATCELIEKVGAKVAGVGFVIELAFLEGRAKLKGRNIVSLVTF